MAYAIYRDGQFTGLAGSEISAREMDALIDAFGYCDPCEPRQRERSAAFRAGIDELLAAMRTPA